MKVSTSGTREYLTTEQHEFISRRILSLPGDTTVITGGCVGVDALIARVAYESGYLRVHTVIPADRRQVDQNWRKFCHTFDEMHPATTMRQRDQVVVEGGDNLLAFPMFDEWIHKTRTGDIRSMRSGTWMTVRIARGLKKPVEVFVLDGISAGWETES